MNVGVKYITLKFIFPCHQPEMFLREVDVRSLWSVNRTAIQRLPFPRF